MLRSLLYLVDFEVARSFRDPQTGRASMFRLFLLAGAGAATPPKIETYGMTSDFDFHAPPPHSPVLKRFKFIQDCRLPRTCQATDGSGLLPRCSDGVFKGCVLLRNPLRN